MCWLSFHVSLCEYSSVVTPYTIHTCLFAGRMHCRARVHGAMAVWIHMVLWFADAPGVTPGVPWLDFLDAYGGDSESCSCARGSGSLTAGPVFLRAAVSIDTCCW